MLTLLQRETLRSTEGQLYKALVSWAEHWIGEGRYHSLQEAISEFIPRIEFEHMGRPGEICRISAIESLQSVSRSGRIS